MNEGEDGPDAAPSSEKAPPAPGRPFGAGTTKRRLVKVAWLVALLFGFALPVGVRVAWEGQAELVRAAEAAEAGRRDAELVHLGRAARWRLPFAGHDDQAIAQLMSLGESYESQGDAGLHDALAAYREARRAILATRAYWISDPDTLDRANRRIASLMAAEELSLGTDLSGEGAQEEYHLALLSKVPGPDPLWGALAALSFLAWIVASVGFVMRALDAQGRLRSRAAVRWGGASLVLLLAWMLLLRFA